MTPSPLSTSESSPKSPSVNGSAKARRPWTPAEDAILKALVGHYGDTRGPEGSWKEIAASISNRTAKDCRKRWFHSLDPSLRKGRWTAEEDKVLLEAYARLGPAWHDIAVLIPGRKDDQCSKRYNDILNPLAKNRLVDWTAQEDELLRQGVQTLGHRWSAISSRIPGRPPLTCRNRWRALSKKAQLGRDASKRNTPSSASQISMGDNSDSPGSHGAGVTVESSNGNVTLDDLPCDLLNSSLGEGDENDASFLNAALYESFSGPASAGMDLQIPDADQSHASIMLDGVALDNANDAAQTTRPDWDQLTRPSNNNPLARLRHPPAGRNGVPESSTWSSISSLDYNAAPSSPTNPSSTHHVWPGPPPLPPDAPFWELLGDDFTSTTQTNSSRYSGPSHQIIHVHHHYHYHITKSDSGSARHSAREQGHAQREGGAEHAPR